MKEETRLKIDEEKQKEIFTNFIKKFNNDFDKASNYLGINKSSLSKYKRAIVHYLPKEVLDKVINYLNVGMPEILYSGDLTQIRKKYFDKAHLALKEKYGKDWAKELTKRRDFKGIHLNDFSDNIFVYLEEDYRKQLFEAASNLFGSLNRLAKFLDISPSRLTFWIYGKQKD